MSSSADILEQAAVDGTPWAVRGARVLSAEQEPRIADVVITGGRIAAIEPAGAFDGGPVLDADGLDIMPGAIDVHVHLRDPGQTHKETVETGTAAAAAGGTTLVCDMPSTLPPVATAQEYADKRRAWAGRASVDFALWAGGTDESELRAMAAAGAIGLKIYMATAPGFDPLYAPDDATVRALLALSGELGWAVAVHAGDQAASDAERDALIAAGRTDPGAVLEMMRGPGNLTGLRTVLALAQELGVRTHIAHVGAYGIDAVELFLAARRAHPLLTAETCVPALSEEDDLPRLGVRVLPTVFDAAARERILAALADGRIDVIATDHAPHTRAEKDAGEADAWAAPIGYPAVETSLALAYDAMVGGALSPRRFVDAIASASARILGLTTKGRIAPGCDADLVLADPGGSWTVHESELHSKAGWSPFHGRTLRGRLLTTYLRGRRIAHNGTIVRSGGGRFVGRIPVGARSAGEA